MKNKFFSNEREYDDSISLNEVNITCVIFFILASIICLVLTENHHLLLVAEPAIFVVTVILYFSLRYMNQC